MMAAHKRKEVRWDEDAPGSLEQLTSPVVNKRKTNEI